MDNLEYLLNNIYNEKLEKIIPENIKKDITILGITGTLSSGIDTSDANATASNIEEGKTAYVNGEKITGSLSYLPGIINSPNATFDVLDSGSSLAISASNLLENRSVIDASFYTTLNILYEDIVSAIGLTPDKIKSGETILGVTGTYTGETI